MALDELVSIESYRLVSDRIHAIAACASSPTLLQLIFDRLEAAHGSHIIATLLSQVGFSINGMMESELCSITEVEGGEGGLLWCVLINTVAQLMSNRNGMLTLVHKQVADAIKARYMSTRWQRWAVASLQAGALWRACSGVSVAVQDR